MSAHCFRIEPGVPGNTGHYVAPLFVPQQDGFDHFFNRCAALFGGSLYSVNRLTVRQDAVRDVVAVEQVGDAGVKFAHCIDRSIF